MVPTVTALAGLPDAGCVDESPPCACATPYSSENARAPMKTRRTTLYITQPSSSQPKSPLSADAKPSSALASNGSTKARMSAAARSPRRAAARTLRSPLEPRLRVLSTRMLRPCSRTKVARARHAPPKESATDSAQPASSRYSSIEAAASTKALRKRTSGLAVTEGMQASPMTTTNKKMV